MSYLDFIFTRGSGLGGALVRHWTRSPYAHVMVSAPSWAVDAAPGYGVRWRSDIPIGDTRRVHVAADLVDSVHDWLKDEIGCKYDYFGDIACVLPGFAREHPRRWFCSELGTAILQRVNILAPWVQPWRHSPQGLYDAITIATWHKLGIHEDGDGYHG